MLSHLFYNLPNSEVKTLLDKNQTKPNRQEEQKNKNLCWSIESPLVVNPCCCNWVNLHVMDISWWPQLTETGFSLFCVQFLKIINKRYDSIFSVNVSNNIETERVNMQVAPLATAFPPPLLSPDTNTVNSCAWLLPGVYQGRCLHTHKNYTLTHVYSCCFVYHKCHPRICIAFIPCFFSFNNMTCKSFFLTSIYTNLVVFKSCIVWHDMELLYFNNHHLTTGGGSYSSQFFSMRNISLYLFLFSIYLLAWV